MLGIANYHALLAMAQLARMPTLLAAALAEHHRFQQDTNEDAIGLEELDELVRHRVAEAPLTQGG